MKMHAPLCVSDFRDGMLTALSNIRLSFLRRVLPALVALDDTVIIISTPDFAQKAKESWARWKRATLSSLGRLLGAHLQVSLKCTCCALALLPLAATAQDASFPSAPATSNVEPRLYISATDVAELISKATAGAQSGKVVNGKSPFNGTTLVGSGLFRARLEYHKATSKSVTQQYRANPNDAEFLVVLEGKGVITFGTSLADAMPSTNGSFVGKSLIGEVSYKLAKGDVVILPEGSPHAITEVEGKLILISLHLPHPAAPPEAAPTR